MNTRAKPRARKSPSPDSLAYAIRAAGALVASVMDGRNLTEAFERMQQASPEWQDGIRGAVRDLAWSTVREYGRGDAALGRFLSKPLPSNVHALLLVAVHRLLARPEQAHTIVDQTVDAVSVDAPGLKGVANGVLRNCLRQLPAILEALETDPVSRHCHPLWWIERVRRDHPDAWADILAAGNGHPPMSLRVNRRRTQVGSVLKTLQDAGIGCRRLDNVALLLDRPVPVTLLPGFAEGLVSIQDAGAQWAAPLLETGDGHRVLDACAAPGGKTAHILERADASMLALDLDPVRIGRVRANLDRLGLVGETCCADVRDLEKWWDKRPFDRILADVPCSASGVVRRHPDIKWLRREQDIAGFVRQQRQIVDALWQTLAPGGRMLYATCSVFREENADQVTHFLDRYDDMERLPLDGPFEQQLLPSSEHDGFYYALMRKRG